MDNTAIVSGIVTAVRYTETYQDRTPVSSAVRDHKLEFADQFH